MKKGPIILVVVVLVAIGLLKVVFSDPSSAATPSSSAPTVDSVTTSSPGSAVATDSTPVGNDGTTQVTATTGNQSPPSTDATQVTYVAQVAPDGTPLSGDAPVFSTETTTASAPASEATPPPGDTTVVENQSGVQVLDFAEEFVSEYYTVNPGESVEQWADRVEPYTTPEMDAWLNQMSWPNEVSMTATVPHNDEIPGRIEPDYARFDISVIVQQYKDGVAYGEPASFSTNVLLVSAPEGWLVADLDI